MPFQIVPGLPGMKAEIGRLQAGLKAGTLDKDDVRLAKKLFKAIANLARDPYYPALESHEIPPLTARFSPPGKTVKVFQSYLENQTPSAGRLYWVYGPERQMITLVGLEPHPEDRKNSGYARVELSRMPTAKELAAEAAAAKGTAPDAAAGQGPSQSSGAREANAERGRRGSHRCDGP
jgi:hypothetical protein